MLQTLLTSRNTLSERVASQFGRTRTNRIVINYDTLGSDTARSRAGIYAFLIIASHVGETIGTDNTFGSTIRWCIQISRETRADSLVLYSSTLTIRPTGCRITRIFWYYVCSNVKNIWLGGGSNYNIDHSWHNLKLIVRMSTIYWGALHERVARHSLRASTDWYMIYDSTQGIDTADSETTRISTLVFNTSPVSRTIWI